MAEKITMPPMAISPQELMAKYGNQTIQLELLMDRVALLIRENEGLKKEIQDLKNKKKNKKKVK